MAGLEFDADLHEEKKRRFNVALVYPPFDDKRDRSAYYVVPPLGLLYLASYLEHEGFCVEIHDQIYELKTGILKEGPHLYQVAAERIVAGRPDVVCFSTQCTTSPGSVSIAKRVKALCPGIPIVLGGHDVSFIAEDYLHSFAEIDYVLAGEAEKTLPELIHCILGGGDSLRISGAFSRKADGSVVAPHGEATRVKVLDHLLPPAYHLVPDLRSYFALSRRPTILVDSGRGCAFACEFCQTTLLNGTKIRYRTVSSLVDELKVYKQRYGDFEAYFVHDLFTARRGFVEDLCDALIEADLGIRWQCRCRIDQVDRNLLARMARAGCRMLLYGIESGSHETLSRMNKRAKVSDPQDIVELVKQTVDAGIFPSLSMVVGTPEESLADLDATMALAYRFQQLGSVNAFIQLMSPLPGTALAKRLMGRFTYKGQGIPTAFSQGIEFDNGKRLEEDEALISSHPHIFQSFQTVVPDHGDFDLCVDVSTTYCKLLEIYRRTFGRLRELRGSSYLAMFSEWRQFSLKAKQACVLGGLKDFEIWDLFELYVRHECGSALSSDPALSEFFHFEHLLREVTESPPVHARKTSGPATGPLALADGAKLYRADGAIEGFPDSGNALIVATPDRLHLLELTEDQADAIALALDQDGYNKLSDRAKDAIARLTRPLVESGILVPEADSRFRAARELVA
ncbi:B12-binding domain-containing radical SAM protein [Sinorhizobium meliloti SM11]|uniref:Probable coenzyme B12-binding/radical SAM n=1 Tax=Sinorhizobium meliloti (strain SM11) TaxID=707241 RepID=A4KVE1_SINMM|nr:radical SAM protein [Sinorhizobium meliloti]ABN47042.1 probable coenzyme B12-binding/radical SAM [Sinorhizobium meliloti SM11]MDE4561852.1 B12-binding domain-containing radical SAM protein [Sinorhizobium meliloti SM11]